MDLLELHFFLRSLCLLLVSLLSQSCSENETPRNNHKVYNRKNTFVIKGRNDYVENGFGNYILRSMLHHLYD